LRQRRFRGEAQTLRFAHQFAHRVQAGKHDLHADRRRSHARREKRAHGGREGHVDEQAHGRQTDAPLRIGDVRARWQRQHDGVAVELAAIERHEVSGKVQTGPPIAGKALHYEVTQDGSVVVCHRSGGILESSAIIAAPFARSAPFGRHGRPRSR
jgi:hypothetical protein